MNHFEILSTVVVLLIGVWSLLYIHQKASRFAETGLKNLFYFILFFNIFTLYLFLYLYFFNNLNPFEARSFLSVLKTADRPVRTVLALAVFFFQFRTIAWQRGKTLPLWLIIGTPVYVILLAGLYRSALPVASVLPKTHLFNYWTLWIWPLNAVVVTLLLKLYLTLRDSSDPDERRVGNAFIWFFLGHILVQISLDFLSAKLSFNWIILCSRILSIYTNLIPLLWLHFFYSPWSLRLSKIIDKRKDLESFRRHHALTDRETEILKLIVDGKSYKEIEDILFISIHTVKTHVYNLYRKIGVGSRHQLIHKIVNRSQ